MEECNRIKTELNYIGEDKPNKSFEMGLLKEVGKKHLNQEDKTFFIKDGLILKDRVKEESEYVSDHFAEDCKSHIVKGNDLSGEDEMEAAGSHSLGKNCISKAGGMTSHQIHMITPNAARPYRCSICSFSAAQIKDLQMHTRIHTGSYKCSICPFAAARREHLDGHVRRHTGEIPYRCEMCPFTAARKDHFVLHMRRKHTGEKPFKCNICTYASADKRSLRVHMMVHSGEKPYKCDICSFAASQKKGLQRHTRTHTGEVLEKPYKCDLCSFVAARKQDISRHMTKHTGEKPYKCPTCSYDTAQKHHLERHMRNKKHNSTLPVSSAAPLP